jgi:hypothetical protein
MTYEKPEVLEIGNAAELVLGTPKQIGETDLSDLPKTEFMQIAEFDE